MGAWLRSVILVSFPCKITITDYLNSDFQYLPESVPNCQQLSIHLLLEPPVTFVAFSTSPGGLKGIDGEKLHFDG